LTDPYGVLVAYEIDGHCGRCDTAARWLYPVEHPDRPGAILWVGSECLTRLTTHFREKANGNFVTRIGRDYLTVYRNAIGYWEAVFRGRVSRYYDSAEKALDCAYDFAMEVRHA
jgi:hypothetical protein